MGTYRPSASIKKSTAPVIRLCRVTAATGRGEMSGIGQQSFFGYQIAQARLFNSVLGQARAGRLLVPVQRVQVIAHKLLVEAGRADAGLPLVGGPEPRAVGCKHLVNQVQTDAVDQAEFTVGVGQ